MREKCRTVSTWKKLIAAVLTFILFFGGINIAPKEMEEVKAGNVEASGLTITSTNYSGTSHFLFYFKANDGTGEDTTSWKGVGISASTVTLNGTSVATSNIVRAVEWTGSQYLLTIKFAGLGISSYADAGTYYITIPAGTTMGKLTLSKAICLKIVGRTTGASIYTSSPVYGRFIDETEIPNGLFLAGVAYRDSETSKWEGFYDLTFKWARGGTYESISEAEYSYIRVDGRGTNYWVKSRGSTTSFTMRVYYWMLNPDIEASGTNSLAANVGERIVRIPAGTIKGAFKFDQDFYFKIPNRDDSADYPYQMEYSTVTMTPDISYTSDYYTIYFKPDDNRPMPYVNSGTNAGATLYGSQATSKDTTTVLVDGVSQSVRQWIYYNSGKYCLTLKYANVESGAGSNVDMVGLHTVTLPAGTVVGDIVLPGDVSFEIHGKSIRQVTEVTLNAAESAYNDNNKWFVLWIKVADKKVHSSLLNHKETIIIDGMEKEATWIQLGNGQMGLAIKYDTLKKGATTASSIDKHYVIVPAGIDIGDRQTANDICVMVGNATNHANKVIPVETVNATLNQGAGTNTDKHFIFWLQPESGTIVSPGKASTVAYIDGKKVDDAIYKWLQGSATYGACIKYTTIEDGMTGAGDMKQSHGVLIPRGTYVGDMVLANDIYCRIKGWNVNTSTNTWVSGSTTMAKLNNITLNHQTPAVNDTGYSFTMRIKGTAGTMTNWATTPLVYIDGEAVRDTSITYSVSGSSLTMTVPYGLVKSGATSSSNITSRVMITIPKGTPIGNMILTRDMSYAVKQSTITEILAPAANLTATVASGSTASSLKLTTKLTDKLSNASYDFASYGVYVNRAQQPSTQIKKTGDGAYEVSLSGVTNGTTLVVKGTVLENCYSVNFKELSLKWNGSAWVEYVDYDVFNHSPKNDSRNCGPSRSGVYIRVSVVDPLSTGTYKAADFVSGGIYKNNAIASSATLQKQSDSMYYIETSGLSMSAGDILKLEGTIQNGMNKVVFRAISFIKNTDGSFSEYSYTAAAIPAKTVTLDKVYVNLDKDGGYDPTFAPLITGETSVTKVNGTTTTSKITTPGTYSVTRQLGNVLKIRAMAPTTGDITYTQTVVTYKTGDVNNDGTLGAKDLVASFKKVGGSGQRGQVDLDYSDSITANDCKLLKDLLVDVKTPADIYNTDESINIGSISDTHYQQSGRDGQTRINTIKALNYYKSQNVDVLIMNGDVVDLGQAAEYTALVADIKKVYSDPTTYPQFILTGDNHEWWDAWTVNGHVPTATFAQTQTRFNEQFSSLRGGLTDTNSYYVENGYHFIGISSDGMNGGQCTYDADTIAFAKEKLDLAYAASSTKPIFLAIHQAPPNTVKLSEGADCFSSAEMAALLKNYPNLIVTTGHTHVPLQDENSIHQEYYTTVQTSTTHYAGAVNTSSRMANYIGTKADGTTYDGNDQMSEKYEISQGLIFRVKGRVVDIERRDFYNDDKIASNWVVTAGVNTTYPKMTSESSRGGSGDQVVITETGSSVTWVNDTDAILKLANVSDKTYVDYYVIEVYQNGTYLSGKQYSGLFFLGLNSDRYKSPSIPISGLDSSKSYVIKVIAVDPFGNGTSGTSKSFTLNAK